MTPAHTYNPSARKTSLWTKLLQWIAAGEAGPRADLRNQMRVKASFGGEISGPAGTMQMRGIDLHHAGIGVKVWHRLEPGTVVFLHITPFQSVAFAFVRHCTWRGLSGYRVGLEFRSPLMRRDVGAWQFKQVKQAVGSPERWHELTSGTGKTQ